MTYLSLGSLTRKSLLKLRPMTTALVTVMVLTGYGCGKGGGGRGGAGGVAPPAEPNRQDIGEEVPPITNDNVSTLETGDTGPLFRLLFETSGNVEAGRYLSEYLLVVRASADSCIRLKVRPIDGGVDDGIDTSSVEGVSEGEEACGEVKQFDPSVFRPDVAEKEDDADDQELDGANLHLAGLEFTGITERGQQASFHLTGETLCGARIFRMPQNAEGTQVATKTGRLLNKHEVTVAGEKRYVRVWGDEEIARFTCDGAGMHSLPRVAFAQLWQLEQDNINFKNYYDRFLKEHVSALAQNTAASYKTLVESFGKVSDVDRNGGIDVFISPDVNRRHVYSFNSGAPNSLGMRPIHRPEDLANYNAISNPMSNEGEIIYIWAPDPAGIYRNNTQGDRQIFPGSSSLTSNYARGYIGAQIMGLILANEKLIVQRGQPEAAWLRETLMLLAANYVGGTAYTLPFTSQYLTSRPQAISLTKPTDDTEIPARYRNIAWQERKGLQTIFGWYLHASICGDTLRPCEGLRSLIDSAARGEASVEELLDRPFRRILENFGLAVGVALADNPTNVRAFWDTDDDKLPPKAPIMPRFAEITNGAATEFVQLSRNANEFVSGTARRHGGPFTSLDSELFQGVLPDYDLDIKLAENSVTYVLLSGLLEEITEMTAALGPNLNVVFIPLGDRQTAPQLSAGYRRTRFIHTEKVSELASADVRPTNLTSWVSERTLIPNIDAAYRDDLGYPETLNYGPMEYPEVAASKGAVVTRDRELWVFGSVDNFNAFVEKQPVAIGNTDSYVIEVNPCLEAPDQAACESKEFELLVQLTSRDHPQDLSPMQLITPTLTGFYRGGRLLATVAQWNAAVSDAIVSNATTNGREEGQVYVPIYCEAYADYSEDSAHESTCGNGGIEGKFLFDNDHYLLAGHRFAGVNDNFLFSDALGYPFFSKANLWRTQAEREDSWGHLAFSRESLFRQFYNFRYQVRRPNIYRLMPFTFSQAVSSGNLLDPDEIESAPTKTMDADEVVGLRRFKGDLAYFLEQDPATINPESERFIEYLERCGAFIDEGLCEDPHANLELIETAILAFTADRIYSCFGGNSTDATRCVDIGTINQAVEITFEAPDHDLQSWNLLILKPQSAGDRILTYYPPVSTRFKRGEGYCGSGSGIDPVDHQGTQCRMAEGTPFETPDTDIRQQFNLTLGNFISDGRCLTGSCEITQYRVLADNSSYQLATGDENRQYIDYSRIAVGLVENEGWYHSSQGTPWIAGTGNQQFMPLNHVAGEVIDKQRRMHALRVKIPTAGLHGDGSTIINLLVGGLNMSEGKYFLRARLVEVEASNQ